MSKIYFLFLFLLIGFSGYGQNFSVPYKVVGGKMVIQIELNGKSVAMIFDTGGQSTISLDLKNEWQLPVIRSQNIKDSNSQVKSMDIVQVDRVSITGTEASFSSYPFLVADSGFFACFDNARGLIGSDLFQNCTIEINSKESMIKVMSGGVLKNNDRRCLPFSSAQNVPVIAISIGKYAGVDAIFDTGSPYFLDLKEDQISSLLAKEAIQVKHKGKGGRTMGVHGFVDQPEKVNFILPDIYMGKLKFSNVHSSLSPAPLSLIGMEILKYGTATVDYVNRLFRFDAFNDIEFTDKRTFWDVNLTLKDGKLVVLTVWEHAKGDVALDDEVTHIDGVAVGDVNYCESITTGLPLLKDKTQAILTLKTKQGIKKITIKKS